VFLQLQAHGHDRQCERLSQYTPALSIGKSNGLFHRPRPPTPCHSAPGGWAAAETSAYDGTASTSERRVHTRTGVQDAATVRGMRHTGPSRARWGDVDAGRPCLPTHAPCAGRRQAEQETAASLPMGAVGDGSVTHEARSGGRPGAGFLADTGWGNGRWVCRKFQMLEDLPHHLAVRDGGDDPQRPPLTERAARHLRRKHALQQSCPAPAR
jgi:hypothetical protein